MVQAVRLLRAESSAGAGRARPLGNHGPDLHDPDRGARRLRAARGQLRAPARQMRSGPVGEILGVAGLDAGVADAVRQAITANPVRLDVRRALAGGTIFLMAEYMDTTSAAGDGDRRPASRISPGYRGIDQGGRDRPTCPEEGEEGRAGGAAALGGGSGCRRGAPAAPTKSADRSEGEALRGTTGAPPSDPIAPSIPRRDLPSAIGVECLGNGRRCRWT